MKKKGIFIVLVLLCLNLVKGQTTLFFQGFEGSGADTWGISSADISSLTAGTGSKSGVVGTSGLSSTLLLNAVTLNTSCASPILTLYHSVRAGSGSGMDTREGASIFVSLNGGAWIGIEQVGGFGDIAWAWNTTGGSSSASAGCNVYQAPNPITYNIPGGTTTIALKIVSCTAGSCSTFNTNITNGNPANYDRADEGFYIDDIKITTPSPASCATLPIVLADFFAVKNNTSNELVWKVASEEGIQNYTVEKSSNAIDFTSLGNVWPGKDNFEMKTYSLTDTQPYNGITYYRLSTKEKNGSITYYTIIYVEGNTKEWSFTHYQDDSDIIIDFKSSVPKEGAVNLYGMDGKLLAAKAVTDQQVRLSKGTIADGIYFVRITTLYKSANFKIVISR